MKALETRLAGSELERVHSHRTPGSPADSLRWRLARGLGPTAPGHCGSSGVFDAQAPPRPSPSLDGRWAPHPSISHQAAECPAESQASLPLSSFNVLCCSSLYIYLY